jgi:xylose isomerase
MGLTVFEGSRSYFPTVKQIRYEGTGSDNPLAFKVYDADKVVAGRTMKEHLRFAVAYWHTFLGTGSDPFGPGTRKFPWDEKSDPLAAARDRVDAAFEFVSKLGAPYYCFHDRDMAPEGKSVEESEANLACLVELARERQQKTGVKLLWGTANLFSHPRYMCGAATNPDFSVLTHAAAQVKAALDATVALGGENYVFWGGREGYVTLWNTDMKRELANFGQFLKAARDYARSIGFKGVFLVEPKPMEPMKHQYDRDAKTVIGFLHEHGLEKDFKLNIEANHATLAGHSFGHELQVAADAGMLGSIDANRGNPQNGWDTDQFPVDMYDCVEAMLVVLANGGLHSGGLNFDAKARRESTDLEDLFVAHIGGMDAFARGLLIADKIRQNGKLAAFKAARYASYASGAGKDFTEGKLGLAALRDLAAKTQPKQISGKQEQLENLVNELIFG